MKSGDNVFRMEALEFKETRQAHSTLFDALKALRQTFLRFLLYGGIVDWQAHDIP